MNIDEKDKDAKYKEWCNNNAEFLGRYTAEVLDNHKVEWEKIINEHINKKIKEYLLTMSKEEWNVYNNNIYSDIDKLVEYLVKREVYGLMNNANNLRGYRVLPDYNIRGNGYLI